jgi:signal transduction histidine kinase
MDYEEVPAGLPLAELRDIEVFYGTLHVLDGLSITVMPGEIHAIVGEHGAGKSSLARVLSGVVQPDAGKVIWKGRLRQAHDVNSARKLGIEFVTQDNEFFYHQSVAYNLFVNRPKALPNFFNPRKITREADKVLGAYNVSIPAGKTVAGLSQAERVLIDIVRHLYTGPRLLILDEALEKLSAVDLLRVQNHLRRLVQSGSSVLFITHRIDDIYEFSDRVTIVRSGRALITESVKDIDKVSLIKLAYTQIQEQVSRRDINRDFYDFLKYNEAILERLPVNLAVVDREGLVKLMNREAQTYLGLDGAPFGTPVAVLLKTLTGGTGPLLDAIERGKSWSAFNLGLELAGGEQRLVDLTLSPIKDGNSYIGSIVIVNDTTEQQRLRERIAFSERLASIGLLAAGVAHEINNPLESIYGSLDSLKMQIGDNPALKRIENDAEAIEHIVRNLITFGDKEGAGEEIIDLNELLGEIINLIRYNTKYRGINVEWSAAEGGGSVFVRANKIELRQVVLNLFKNGIEAMAADSGKSGILRVRLSVKPAEGQAVVEVDDNGPGIPGGDIRSVFLPFYSTKRGSAGHMGLGLSISYGLIQKMGGTIAAQNLNPGCRFTVKLPLAG